MTHSFRIKIKDEISSIIRKAGHEVEKIGGKFEGDTKSGSLSGKTALGVIQGKYHRISEDELEITITRKPFTVPFSMIEMAVKKLFA